MAAQLSFPPFPTFNTKGDPSSLGPNWIKYTTRFDNWLLGCNIKDDSRKRALLLHCAGEDVQDIFETLSDVGEAKDYELAVKKLSEYFLPKKNPVFEKFKFYEAEKQRENESIDDYQTRLRKLAKTCDFSDIDDAIMTRIIHTCTSESLQKKVLRKPDLTLEKLLEIARADELADRQTKQLRKNGDADEVHINAIQYSRPGKPKQKTTLARSQQLGYNTRSNTSNANETTCRFCGGPFPHRNGRQSCPAFRKTCMACSKQGHFARVCKSTTSREEHFNANSKQDTQKGTKSKFYKQGHVHVMEHEEHNDESHSHIFAIQRESCIPTPAVTIQISGVSIPFMLDSGSSVNLISEDIFESLPEKIQLQETSTKIYPYGSTNPLDILGCFETELKKGNDKCNAVVYVTPKQIKAKPILSYDSLRALNCSLDVALIRSEEYDSYFDEFPQLTKGIGKLKDHSVLLHIDESVPPTAQPHRRIPFHLRDKVKNELQHLIQEDIIEPVEGPSTWISPVVIAPKPGNMDEIRLCIDMRMANKAIQRERHVTPTMDDISYKLNGAQYFSKIDLIKGYHQLELDPSSRPITTFSTHLGLVRFKRLFFGVCSASEHFQKVIETLISDIPNATNSSDDILVSGKNKKEHDDTLRQVLRRLSEVGLTVNQKKCIFGAQQIEFHGHIFSKHGIQPDPRRVQDIKNLAVPRNVAELKSLLGLIGYCSKFIRGYSTITAPLRMLTKKNTDWTWGSDQQEALDKLKRVLSTTGVTFFDRSLKTILSVDASPFGLGAVLAQEDVSGQRNIVAYASRSLAPAESRYSQTEREALAVVWGCEHFTLYLTGAPFQIVTDHKPLIQMFNKPTAKVSARLERWILRLQCFEYELTYAPGENNPADYFSRHPTNISGAPDEVEEQVRYIAVSTKPRAITLQTVQKEIQQDKTLQAVAEAIRTGKWYRQDCDYKQIDQKEFNSFRKVKDELTLVEDLLLKANRLVLPYNLRLQTVHLAHEGHPGIVKTKQLLRSKVWYPGMDKMVEEEVQTCIACQAQDKIVHREPMKIMESPTRPWSEISTDFLGPLPTGQYVLVVIDDFSRYPVAVVTTSTSASNTILILRRIFSLFGVPEILRSDNGPPFNSEAMKEFANLMGFRHRKITPEWPQANGIAERMMQSIMKTIRAARIEQKDWQAELEQFMCNYRATPHSTTGKTPGELFFGRCINTKLPQIFKPDHCHSQEKEKEAKEKRKENTDEKNKAKESTLKVGDMVLKRQRKVNKFSARFDHRPYRIKEKKGSMITAERDGKETTRNSSYFKIWNQKLQNKDYSPQLRPEAAQPQRYNLRSQQKNFQAQVVKNTTVSSSCLNHSKVRRDVV